MKRMTILLLCLLADFSLVSCSDNYRNAITAPCRMHVTGMPRYDEAASYANNTPAATLPVQPVAQHPQPQPPTADKTRSPNRALSLQEYVNAMDAQLKQEAQARGGAG